MHLVKTVVSFILSRLREPSTLVAGSFILALLGFNVPPEAQGYLTQIADSISVIIDNGHKLTAAVLAIIAMVTPDRSASMEKRIESSLPPPVAKD